MHAYIGYYSVSALAGPIVICVLWENGSTSYYQVNIDLIDSSDFNSGLMHVLKHIVSSYPEHRFTARSIFSVGRNCRTVMAEKDHDHQQAVYNAKVYFQQIMRIYDEQYPTWRFTEHWGENNRLHKEIINSKRRILPVHRKTFWPCSKFSRMDQRRLGKGKLKKMKRGL